jgi:hypothetical protein
MLGALASAGVRFIVIGGIAAAVHGSRHATFDLDVVCDPSEDNLGVLAGALTQLQARVKGSPNPPAVVEPDLLKGISLLTLETSAGELDLLFEAAGGATYQKLAADAETAEVVGQEVLVVSRADLIDMKRAAGRPIDMAVADELEAMAILEELEPDPPG